MNIFIALIIALTMQTGLNNPGNVQPGDVTQGGGNRQQESACKCKDEIPEQHGNPAAPSVDKDPDADSSPYVSCRRRANRTPGCQCRCPNDNQEGVEVKTGPYGLKQKPKKPG